MKKQTHSHLNAVKEKIQHPFIIKALIQQGRKGNYPKIIRSNDEYPTVNINVESLKTFPLRSETRQGCLLLPILFNIVLEVIPRAVSQEKDIKGIQTGKEKD